MFKSSVMPVDFASAVQDAPVEARMPPLFRKRLAATLLRLA